MTDKEELSVSEVAEKLSVSSQTVRELIRQGHLDARRKTPSPLSHFVVKRASVESYMKRMGIHAE